MLKVMKSLVEKVVADKNLVKEFKCVAINFNSENLLVLMLISKVIKAVLEEPAKEVHDTLEELLKESVVLHKEREMVRKLHKVNVQVGRMGKIVGHHKLKEQLLVLETQYHTEIC